MKSILDPTFRYTPSFSTDLRKTFARVRRDGRGASLRSCALPDDPQHKVASLVGRTAKIRARSV
jgi:hypothetical protein